MVLPGGAYGPTRCFCFGFSTFLKNRVGASKGKIPGFRFRRVMPWLIPARRNRHGFYLLKEMARGPGTAYFDDSEPDRCLEYAEQQELWSHRHEAKLTGFSFVKKAFESGVTKALRHGLQSRKSTDREGRRFPGVTQGGIPCIRAHGPALFQQRGIADFGFVTIPD